MNKLTAIFLLAIPCWPASLEVFPEHLRPDPYGGIVAADRTSGADAAERVTRLLAARAGYVSCHLVVKIPEGGDYRLKVEFAKPAAGIEADLYREWFHWVPAAKSHYPDALIPVQNPHSSRLPEPDNRIISQTAQAFWLDVWVAPDAAPGAYPVKALLESGGKTAAATFELIVLPATVPAEDAVAMDHNSYGSSFITAQYPAAAERASGRFFLSDEFFALIHAYHRIFYEHRGVFHQLGYGHGGKVGPEFAPALEGRGKKKRISDWTLYDRHYGPLFDGSAFARTRRGAHPIRYVYLPINPEWPASFLAWGEPGYEAEFVNVVSEIARHFRDKGWTKTKFELFFNHKKRYKGFPWDGDETRFAEDLAYFREYRRLLDKAVPPGSPAQFVFRTDASWMMERQFRDQAGVINFWVCGGGMFSWFPSAPKLLKERGDIVWTYGGTPSVTESSSSITLEAVRPWMFGIDGFVRWQTVAPGRDPWFQFDGGGTALVYSGERCGVAGPIPGIRLKIQRNALQDLALLERLRKSRPGGTVEAEVARRYNGTRPEEWWTPRPPLADKPPHEMSNADFRDVPDSRKFRKLDAAAWRNVRDYVLELSKEAR